MLQFPATVLSRKGSRLFITVPFDDEPKELKSSKVRFSQLITAKIQWLPCRQVKHAVPCFMIFFFPAVEILPLLMDSTIMCSYTPIAEGSCIHTLMRSTMSPMVPFVTS